MVILCHIMSYYDGILPIYQLLQDFATLHGAKGRGSGALLRGDMRRPSVCTCDAGGTGCSVVPLFFSDHDIVIFIDLTCE